MSRVSVFLFTALAGSNLMAATLHVDLNSTNPTVPYASRETAATDIQTAVNAAVAGDTVQVWDGHYLPASEIYVSKAITIQSVNGPDTTIVDGQGKVRGFNLGDYACVVEGMTITNGYSSVNGGGIYCSGIVPFVTHCTISGNTSSRGGGMCGGTANNCTISGNTASSSSGGGMYGGTANHCILSGNTASSYGGGMSHGTANNCILSGNSAKYGGGVDYGTANNCTITGNTASSEGGGIYNGTANSCILSGNSALRGGGISFGSYGNGYGTANNSTISGNSASEYGGGMYNCTANNCIVWYNTAPSGKDLTNTTARYSCSPDLSHGVDGNITNAPMLVSSSHIAVDSPCRGAGSADYAIGIDIDGEAWANPPSMGCDELADLLVGPIAVDFLANESMVISGYPIRFREQIHGALSGHIWDFGDGTQVTNSLSVEHVWAAGTYDVVLTAYNADWPDGVSATQEVVVVDVEATAIHVSLAGNDANDGTSWASAKKTIQAGVDAQVYAGGGVLVENGTYSLSATITVSKPIRIASVDGTESTIVDGKGKVRCFNLGNTACVIEGLTITNGYTTADGGGIYCSGMVPVITNCTIIGNSAEYGGGMSGGTANHCIISGNSATSDGGGMSGGTANHCTITGNSAGRYGGGMYQGTAKNCAITGNSAEYGGGMYKGTANHCTISGNSALRGGGMYQGTANNCTISGNSATQSGGGMYGGTANNCTISGNTASSWGGGMSHGTANNCILSGNSAKYGGGVDYGTANNCTITGNTASSEGGGMYNCTANNCTISGNSARRGGGMSFGIGGDDYGTANNCIISGNSASEYGGGLYNCTANNCIVWYNTAPSGKDLTNTTARYSCSSDVTHGVNGNITTAPMLVSSSHIAADSPCRGAGSADYATGTDIDGDVWANPPSMGCDEPRDFPVGPIQVDFIADELRWIAGSPVRFQEQIHGAISQYIWDFGDGAQVTNLISLDHAWAAFGTYDVVLSAYNDDWPDGVSATQQIVIASVEDLAIYVSPDGDDANDGTSWTSAKATIQVGVDAQNIVGGWVIVGAGSYPLSSTISISKPVRILGADGPDATIVDGQRTVRCFNLDNSACILEGLSIKNGFSSENGGGIYCSGIVPVITNCTISGNTSSSGGGVYGSTANNCTISGNTASSWGGGMSHGTANSCTISGNNSSSSGGGVDYGTANNCTITGNTASSEGGGMYNGTANSCILSGNSALRGGGISFGSYGNDYGTANNCTISGNSASEYGGGMYNCKANNCIVWYNTAPSGKDLTNTTARYSCSPDLVNGVNGNITNEPVFVDAVNGDYRLAAGSPCIDAGSNGYVVGSFDLAGMPRIVGGVVDMGAYEYQGAGIVDQDSDGLPDDWETEHFGGTTAQGSGNDFDNDGIDNRSEWVSGTNPSDPNSVFTASVSSNQVSADGFVVEWLSVEDRTYSVLWSGSLTNTCDVLQDGIEYPQNSYTDTVHKAESAGFYQIGVRLK